MTEIFDGVRSAVDDVVAAAEREIHDVRVYLASPEGKRLRGNVARGLLAIAPAVAGAPFLRRSWLVRLLGVAGAATIVVKVAEAIRDWEPEQTVA